jgi:hypothetical protein
MGFVVARDEDGLERGFGLTIPVRTLGAEKLEDVDAAAAVGGLEDD